MGIFRNLLRRWHATCLAEPFRLREEYLNRTFEAVYVSNFSFYFLFFVPTLRLIPHLGYFCQLDSRFHVLSLALQDEFVAIRV